MNIDGICERVMAEVEMIKAGTHPNMEAGEPYLAGSELPEAEILPAPERPLVNPMPGAPDFIWTSTPPADVVEGIIARVLHEVSQILDLVPHSGEYDGEGGSGSRLSPDRIVRSAALIAASASTEWGEVYAKTNPATMRKKHRQVFSIWQAAVPRLVLAIDAYDTAGQVDGPEAAAMGKEVVEWVTTTHLVLHDKTSPKDRAEIVLGYLGRV